MVLSLFFSEYKITHQQASFECVDSVFTIGGHKSVNR